MTTALDTDALTACADLVGRSGATEFQIGYMNDEREPAFLAWGPQWYAHAQYRGARLTVENFTRADDAADALARKILAGGHCAHCGLLVDLEGHTSGQCHWWRETTRWVRGCEALT